MSPSQFRFTGNPSDATAFVAFLQADPEIPDVKVSDPRPSTRGDERVGHVELVDVIISIGESVGSKVAYDAIKAAFGRFKRGRRPMDLEDLLPEDDLSEEPSNDERDKSGDT